MIETIQLSYGKVAEVRPVPPYTRNRVRAYLPEPPYPKVTIRSKAGGDETHPALPDTPEYEEYVRARDEHRQIMAQLMSQFCLDYGVIRWKLSEDGEWQDEPPEGWKPPAVLKFYQKHKSLPVIEKLTTTRVLYLEAEVVTSEIDMQLVNAVILGMRPATKEEIVAALAPFDSNETISLWNILQAVEISRTLRMQKNSSLLRRGALLPPIDGGESP